MKTALLSILFAGISIPFAQAEVEAIQGAQYLSQWAGDYEVTECTQCMNYEVSSGENLKNLLAVGVGVFKIQPADHLNCGQTDYTIGFSYTITKDGAHPPDGMSVSFSTGQCDWNAPSGESLVVTPESFDYETQKERGQLKLSLKKMADGSYVVSRHETDSSPSWGFPKDWSFQAKAKKTPLP